MHIALRIANLADDVSGGIPASIRIHHIDEADGEGVGDEFQVASGGCEAHRLARGQEKAGGDEDDNERDLEPGGDVLKSSGSLQAADMDESDEPYHDERPSGGGRVWEDGGEVFAKGHGGQGDGGREADSDGKPAG